MLLLCFCVSPLGFGLLGVLGSRSLWVLVGPGSVWGVPPLQIISKSSELLCLPLGDSKSFEKEPSIMELHFSILVC